MRASLSKRLVANLLLPFEIMVAGWMISATAAVAAVAADSKGPANSATNSSANVPVGWDKVAAARYLDAREVWWQDWPHAQKDHGTICISCHTQVPYALARPALRAQLGETRVSDPERAMLDSILKRVKLGKDAGTFYTDADNGAGKTHESRDTESVYNALILATYDAAGSNGQSGHLQDVTRTAFDTMWSYQEQSGAKAGAWVWQDFHFSPWEAPESEYSGAAMAAIAVGIAPDGYKDDPKIQGNLKLLREYLRKDLATQPLVNRITLLWAAAKLPGLMTDSEKSALVAEIDLKQQADGGWCLTELGRGTWKRHDASPFESRSDGYATGLTVLALEENGLDAKNAAVRRGLSWILANQDKAEGLWPAWSVNVKRDPRSDVGKFMSDAATGYAVMALERSVSK